MKRILTILSCAVLLLTACQQDASLAPGQGHICLRLSADDVLQTRAQQDVDDPSSWYAVISNDSETLYNKKIGEGLSAQTFDAGTYSISVRNYDTPEAAIDANSGWGDAYHTGEASDIEVSAGGTAYVHIACGRSLNAKFRLDYSEFSGIINSLSITAPKTLTFAYADGTLANEAFFEPLATLTYTITYTIAEETKTTEPQTMTLGGAATVSILKIKSDIYGTLSISLTCDNEFEGDAQSDIIIDGASGTDN
ncbi:MAG: DUF4493 domain-containing protein [Bacteroidaceae bacterium]|nr:DUF4493 domain-containing protein [Bacteroidaceae bacterium]